MVSGKLKPASAYQTAQGEARASLELDIDEIGPSLKYATAAVTRRAKEGGAQSPAVASNPWNDAQPAADNWANPAQSASDDTPF